MKTTSGKVNRLNKYRQGNTILLQLPIFKKLENSERILIAGAGGGFDVFCGLPLYFGLQNAGKEVHLANLSFSFLPPIGERISPAMMTVDADSPAYIKYFPEFYLSEWFRKTLNQEIPIHSFERTGVVPLLHNYEALFEKFSLDTIILVDGGTDSLMRGDEDGLGTPKEDIASIAAVHQLDIPHKILACLGFGVDYFHGVSNFLSLQAIAELHKSNGFLGMFSLTKDMPEAELYREATEYVFQQMPHDISIVSSSILASLAGHFGNHHSTSRTSGSTLWINPLMSSYLCFEVQSIVERILYFDAIKDTVDFSDIEDAIDQFRSKITKRKRGNIPN